MHGFANPARFLRIARWLTPLTLVAGGGIAVLALVWGLWFAPADQLQGDTVRIIYLHVPTAWLGMMGWSAIAAASFVEIVWRHPLAGIAARAAAVSGAVFTAVCLATGSLWGRPAWGTWWVWDGRLTSMLVLLFLYFGYLALSAASDEAGGASGGGAGRVAAVFGLVGAVNIPVIHYSVIWWNSLHQAASITANVLMGGKGPMAADFLIPLFAAMLGFTLLFAGVVLMRMRAILATAQAEARLRRKAQGVG
jgi:heme exporter protein C